MAVIHTTSNGPKSLKPKRLIPLETKQAPAASSRRSRKEPARRRWDGAGASALAPRKSTGTLEDLVLFVKMAGIQ